jgi:signal transduction histidine kinase
MITTDYNPNPDPTFEGWLDLKLVSAMRSILAGFALIVTIIDPAEPDRYVTQTYAALTSYTVYSLVLLLLSFNRRDLIPVRIMHWLDVAWYLLLIALSSGTNSIFFNFFFFAILVGSFGWGLRTGLQLTIVSASLFTIVGIATKPSGEEFELNWFLIRSMQLLILGYLISRWGGFKSQLRGRLELLKDVTVVSNPRFGIDRTLNAILERLRSFYDANACLLLIQQKPNQADAYQLYRVRRAAHSTGAAPPQLTKLDAEVIIPQTRQHAVIHRDAGGPRTSLFDLETKQVRSTDSARATALASALEADNFVVVPVIRRKETIGWIYIVDTPLKFTESELDFLLQLIDHITLLTENIQLVDNLASEAAEQERRRIARDIHDSVIQPYLGLQLGISALARKLQAGNTGIRENVEELLDLTNQELAEMRRYVWGLQANDERRGVLLPSIHRYTARFTAVTGIKVHLEVEDKIEINDRLSAELFQIVAEGLSNVRRHALCDEAIIHLECKEGVIVLELKNRRPQAVGENGAASHSSKKLFRPRSIAERTELLGGQTEVLIDENNFTVVRVSIPL